MQRIGLLVSRAGWRVPAQVAERGRFASFWPEHIRQARTRIDATGLRSEISQQGARLVGLKVLDRSLAIAYSRVPGKFARTATETQHLYGDWSADSLETRR